MKLFVIKSLEVVSIIGFFLFIIASGAVGYQSAVQNFFNPVIGGVLGLLFGFVAAVVTFGLIFLVMDIADNTRRARELLEQRGGSTT